MYKLTMLMLKWFFGIQKRQLNRPIISNLRCDKHIWKAYDMPYYVCCAICGKWSNAEIKTTETLDNLHNKIYEIDQEEYNERFKIANVVNKSLINSIADAYGYWLYHKCEPQENIPLENLATE